MRILNFGSLNIDNVYKVSHFVGKGETISSESLSLFCGGKGLNQSVALGRAGIKAHHAGCIGVDGKFLLDMLTSAGVDISCVETLSSTRTGNAIIQNDADGDNCIILYGGANQQITKHQVDRTLAQFDEGDFIVLQNEINELDYIVTSAHKKGLTIIMNPSPMDAKVQHIDLAAIDWFILNEIEAGQLIGKSSLEQEQLIAGLQSKFPKARIVLTLGEMGSCYIDATKVIFQKAYPVNVVDTTGAGDTFTGYFLAGIVQKHTIENALDLAARASAIAVSRLGAANSIPTIKEVAAWTDFA